MEKIENILEHKNDFFKCFHYGFFGRPCIIDRTGELNKFSNIKVQTNFPYPKKHIHKRFEDICFEVASEIVKNEKIVISLSGIDSLVALCSILSMNKNSEVDVIFNNELSDIIRDKILPDLKKRFNFDFHFYQYKTSFDVLSTLKGSCIVTGEMGDQLVGSLFCYLHQDLVHISWKDGLKQYLKRNEIFKKCNISLSLDEIIDMSEISVKESFFDIKSFFDFMKWINFNFVFDFDCNKYIYLEKDNIVNHFFSHELFQTWAITEHNKNRNLYSEELYKFEYKKFIKDISKNNDSMLLKKSASISGYVPNNSKTIVAIDNKNRFIYNNSVALLQLRNYLK